MPGVLGHSLFFYLVAHTAGFPFVSDTNMYSLLYLVTYISETYITRFGRNWLTYSITKTKLAEWLCKCLFLGNILAYTNVC